MTRKIKVDVRASLDAHNRVHFDSSWRSENDPPGIWRVGAIDLPCDTGEHKIEFNLDDRTGLNLEFYDDPDDAKPELQPIWVDVNSCPQGGYGADKGQIFDKVRSSKSKLSIKDSNLEKCDLHYALRFKGNAGQQANPQKAGPPYEFDPVIINGGKT